MTGGLRLKPPSLDDALATVSIHQQSTYVVFGSSTRSLVILVAIRRDANICSTVEFDTLRKVHIENWVNKANTAGG